MGDLARQDAPPPPGPKSEIVRIKAGQRWMLTILSANLEGFWCHWQGTNEKGFSLPCTMPREKCRGCRNMLPRRWKGYIFCYAHHMKKAHFVEVTPGAAEDLVVQLGKGDWRGFRVEIMRGAGDKARLTVDMRAAPTPEAVANLPKALSVEPVLTELWRLGEEKNSRGKNVE